MPVGDVIGADIPPGGFHAMHQPLNGAGLRRQPPQGFDHLRHSEDIVGFGDFPRQPY